MEDSSTLKINNAVYPSGEGVFLISIDSSVADGSNECLQMDVTTDSKGAGH